MGYETELMNGVCPVCVNHAIVVDSNFLKPMNPKELEELMD